MLRARFSKLLQHWLAAKFDSHSDFKLNHSNLLVFPSRYGFWFVLLILLLYLLGTNYQNNLILLLGYFLLSVFLLSIWFAWRNLAELRITVLAPAAVYAGQQLNLKLLIEQKSPFQGLVFYANQQKATASSPQQEIQLQWTASTRGYHAVPPMRLHSLFPLGLIRCWTYLPVQLHYWVYPTPLQNATEAGLTADQASAAIKQSELPEQLKAYQPGDPIRRLHWKRLARQPDAPVIKASEQQPKADPRWLVVPVLQGSALEQKLSEVCYQLLQLEASQCQYGLQTPVGDVALGQGPFHLQQCLQRLALC